MCLIGDFGVGKTSLINRFVDRQFSDQYLSTVGVKISRKLIEVEKAGTPTVFQLLIWDIEGSTKFKTIAPTYLQGAKGAIVVADVTRPETLEHLAEHIERFTNLNPQGVFVIALNKSDLIDPEQLDVLLKASQNYPLSVLSIYSTSAKTGIHVDQLFQTLAKHL
ncbi:MAG: GTP-binding protein [Leptolyngbyaceae cyanobacterium CSU_1_4]|nr:GTP-binding protein [Leptolyngbyaceae cyanobacterium CSU_1_4]